MKISGEMLAFWGLVLAIAVYGFLKVRTPAVAPVSQLPLSPTGLL